MTKYKMSAKLRVALYKKPSETRRLMGEIRFGFTRYVVACLLIFFENLQLQKIYYVSDNGEGRDDKYQVTVNHKDRPKNNLLGMKQLFHHIYSQESLITNLEVNRDSCHRVYMSFRDSATKQHYGVYIMDPSELHESTRQALLYTIGTILYELVGFPGKIFLDRSVMASLRAVTKKN